MDALRPQTVTAEQMYTALDNGTAQVAHDTITQYLRQEAKTNGGASSSTMNAIVKSLSKRTWLTSTRLEDQRALHKLLRPDGILVDTLVQYHVMQRSGRIAIHSELLIGIDDLPSEYRDVDAMPRDFAQRAEFRGGVLAGVKVDALEFLVFRVARACCCVASEATDLLTREYIVFFCPVAVPSRTRDTSAIRQLRDRLHEFSPKKTRPEGASTDMLDANEYGVALELASFVAAAMVVAWLPAVPHAVRTGTTQDWLWEPTAAHVMGMERFGELVRRVALGEQQLEQFHTGSELEHATLEKRMDATATLRDTLRARSLTVAVSDTIGLVFAGLSLRDGDVDDIWVRALKAAVGVWVGYAVPWKPINARTSVWEARTSLIVKGISSVLSVQTLALFVNTIVPRLDLLAEIGSDRDALSVVECVVDAFASRELRTVLATVERAQIAALPAQRAGAVDRLGPDPLVAAVERSIAQTADNAQALVTSESRMLNRAISAQGEAASVVFSGPSTALANVVGALRRAELLSDRQLRLLAPAAPKHLWAVLAGVLTAGDERHGESARVAYLHRARRRIAALYAKVAEAMGVDMQTVNEIKMREDDKAINTAMDCAGGAKTRGSAPDMAHGAVTPRGRWEVKTGRKKFTATSLAALEVRGAEARARSYESQRLVDWSFALEEAANRHYAMAVEWLDRGGYPAPPRDIRFGFRWIAAYQNIRFFAVVAVAVWVFRAVIF